MKKMVEIRGKLAKDVKSISRILSLATQTLRKTYHPKDITDNTSENSMAVLKSLVATMESKVVGVIEYKEYDDSIYFQGLAIDPLYQKRGIARKIINNLETIAKQSGYNKLCMATIEETGNVPIFEKIGFHVISKVVTDRYQSNHYPELHLVAMEKKITTGQ